MKRKLWATTSLLLAILLLAGCGSRAMDTSSAAPQAPGAVWGELESDGAMYGRITTGGAASPSLEQQEVQAQAAQERMIVRTANLDLVVDDTESAIAALEQMVEELEGYIVSANSYQYQQGLQASVTLRVPAGSYSVALERIRALATEVRSQNTSGEDVTEEYVDLASRLRALEAKAERLEELMDQAEDTEAVLAVYQELSSTQQEIELVTGRMQYLERSAAMATISVQLTPDAMAQPITVGGWHPEGTVRDAVQSLIEVLQFFVDLLITLVLLVLPTLLLFVGLPVLIMWLIIRAVVRRRRARRVVTETTQKS